MDRTNGVDRVRLLGAFVRPIALHTGEAKRESTRVARALLHPVEGYLDDKLRTNVNGMRVTRDLKLLEPSGLPFERWYIETFEGLAEHDVFGSAIRALVY